MSWPGTSSRPLYVANTERAEPDRSSERGCSCLKNLLSKLADDHHDCYVKP